MLHEAAAAGKRGASRIAEEQWGVYRGTWRPADSMSKTRRRAKRIHGCGCNCVQLPLPACPFGSNEGESVRMYSFELPVVLAHA